MRRPVCGLGLLVACMLVLACGRQPREASPESRAEQSAAAAAPDTAWFSERARATGLDVTHFNGMSGELYLAEIMAPGVALFDYDNDGDLDVYVVQGQMLGARKSLGDATFPPRDAAMLEDRLFRNDLQVGSDGNRVLRWTDVTDASGIGSRGYGM